MLEYRPHRKKISPSSASVARPRIQEKFHSIHQLLKVWKHTRLHARAHPPQSFGHHAQKPIPLRWHLRAKQPSKSRKACLQLGRGQCRVRIWPTICWRVAYTLRARSSIAVNFSNSASHFSSTAAIYGHPSLYTPVKPKPSGCPLRAPIASVFSVAPMLAAYSFHNFNRSVASKLPILAWNKGL